MTIDHFTNDVLVIETAKYTDKSTSNIIDGTTSAFKFKFVDPTLIDAKDYAVTSDKQIDPDFSTLNNNDNTAITDL